MKWRMALAVCLLGAVCARAEEKALPMLKIETLGAPVMTARLFSFGVAPNTRGGWMWVGQFMNFSRTNKPKHKVELGDKRFYWAYDNVEERPEAEWVVADLQAGTSRVFKWPGFHVPGTPHGSALAGNGRLFFSVDYAQIYYYDPKDETVKPMGCVNASMDSLRCFYHLILGPDGMIYGASQSTNGLATLLRLNPDTLEFRLYDKVGLPKRRKDLTYGYTLEVAPPWMYVAVGQGNWELFAVNADTGEKRCLADVTGDGCRISVGRSPAGCTAQIIAAGAKPEILLLQDGKAEPLAANAEPAAPKTYPRIDWKNTQPMDIAHPPELDKDRRPEVNARGEGEVFWRPAGRQEEFKSVKFRLENVEAVDIESLLPLPDGSLLGNTGSYSGFFRYYPADKRLDSYGKHGASGVQSVWYDGKVWIDGYPNVTLYVYDPAQPWTARFKGSIADVANPLMIGSFGQKVTEAHHCRAILAPGNGRIYICGQRERWSTGAGLGYYDITSGKKFGLGAANKEIHPSGFIALPKLQRLVFSGENKQGGAVELIVYDMDLNEVSRIALHEGLANTGRLFNSDNDNQFIGCYATPKAETFTLYLYDLAAGKMEKSVSIPNNLFIFRRPVDGSFWAETPEGALCRLDPRTLQITPVGQLERKLGHPVWLDRTLYGNCGGYLVRVAEGL